MDRRLLIVFSILGFALVSTFQNCDQARLSLMTELASAKSTGQICAITPTEFDSSTKILFVVDKSGSNDDVVPESPVSDKNAVFRKRVISDFYTKHQTNPSVSWGLNVFQNAGSVGYINDGAPTSPTFTTDIPTFTAAIQRLGAPGSDVGGTPYLAALSIAETTIQTDIARNPDKEITYIIVFISDGIPNSGETQDSILTRVNTLRAIANVSLSTVYYGPPNPDAANLLLSMSSAGGGRFLDTNVSGRIPIDDLIRFDSAEPWIIKNFVVTNLNASPCDDGSMDADSDGDGLCDKDEARYNREYPSDPAKVQRMQGRRYDPYNRNSFSPSLSDGIYHRFILFSESIPRDCTATSDVDGDLLNECEELYIFSNTPSGPTEKWTQAMGQLADPFNFDSDGDGFLDGFEFTMSRNKSAAMDRNNIYQEYFGARLDTIYREHRNLRNPSSSSAYNGELRFSHVNDKGQNCYTYSQSVLPLYRTAAVAPVQVSGNSFLSHNANENVLMIYFIQTPENDPNGPGDLRYIFQRVSASSPQLNLNLRTEDYLSYKVGEDANVKP